MNDRQLAARPARAGGAARWALAIVTAHAAACADFEGTVDPAFGLPDVVVESPTLSRDVQPIFDRRCAFGGCHSAATRQGGLSLVAGASHAALVGRPARLSAGDTIVVPGASSRSWLVRILADDPGPRHGVSRMPLAAPALTTNQRSTIARWIDRGAPPD
ncbi:MAG: hypothetical protein ACLGIK_06085 [Gemmatimonadota bacterium]